MLEKDNNKISIICIFLFIKDRLNDGGVHMDKNFFKKSSNFIKKEGFYVVLFLCLCIVASVAAITSRNAKVNANKTPKSQVEETADNKTEETTSQIPNAEVVTEDKEDKAEDKETSKSQVTQPVSNSSNQFINPVQGEIVRGYSYPLPVWVDTMEHYRSVKGIDIGSAVGTDVKAVADGVVEKVDNNKAELGQYVLIKHANGLITVYSNLDEKVSVKNGDTVKQGQVIGKVGKTATTFIEEKYGDHLNFQVINTTKNEQVDPTGYLSLKVADKSQ